MDARHYDPIKLKRIREERRITQSALARQLDVERQTISRAERGKNVPYELLCDISAVLDFEVITLLYPRPLDQASGR